MGNRTDHIILTLIAFLIVTLEASWAQRLQFNNYSTKVHNEVRCIFQDSQGYLWIGTIEGISRFDGATFTNYTLEEDSSAKSAVTFVNTFCEDRERNLWIGLNLEGKFHHFYGQMEYPLVIGMTEDQDRTIWVATYLNEGGGLP